MTTLHELVTETEHARRSAERRRKAAESQIRSITQFAGQQGRARLTAEEDRDVDKLLGQRDSATGDLEKLSAKMEELRAIVAEEADNTRATQESRSTGAKRASYDHVARVGFEQRTYRPDEDPNGKTFLRDIASTHLFNDPTARQRLDAHHREESVERAQYLTRAVGTGAYTGLVVPQYLTDMYAPATAALRPFADVCNKHNLPESGMTVEISRITTASSVDLQATQNTAVSETNMDDTLLTLDVQTAAGQQTISRQAIERGTGIDDVTMNDLFRRYATKLDSTLITQASTGLSAVAATTTYTDASPTVAELWPKLYSAQNDLEGVLLGQAMPTHFVMHPRRWNWMTSQVGSTWPTIGSAVTPVQAFGVALTNEYGTAVRGVLSNGMRVTVDANVPTNKGAGTNEDEIYAIPSDECHLWEDPNAPVFIRAEQPAVASLGVLFVVYGYFAYTFARYTNGMGKIAGTGLTPPSFA